MKIVFVFQFNGDDNKRTNETKHTKRGIALKQT